MICPCEKKGETSVVDSRPTEDGTAIRRRRMCVCGEILLINFSAVPVSIGLFLRAIYIDLESLSLSNGDFLPFFLTTISSLN